MVVWLSGYGFDLFTDIPKLYGAVSPEVAAKIPVGADWQEREAIAVGRPAEPLPWDADYVEPFDPHEALRDSEGNLLDRSLRLAGYGLRPSLTRAC